MTPVQPGYDEVVLFPPDGTSLCNSRGCADGSKLAEVIVAFGTFIDPGAGYHDRGALWRESWSRSLPMCAACWESARQVAVKYRPRLVIIDATGQAATPQPSGGRT
jgi:hypothetical protein